MDTMNQMPNNNIGGVEPAKKSYGALIAVIVILVLMVIGGLYFLGQRMSDTPYKMDSSTQGNDEVTQSMQSQSNSDDTASIEADLKATDIDSLDQGAAAFESQME